MNCVSSISVRRMKTDLRPCDTYLVRKNEIKSNKYVANWNTNAKYVCSVSIAVIKTNEAMMSMRRISIISVIRFVLIVSNECILFMIYYNLPRQFDIVHFIFRSHFLVLFISKQKQQISITSSVDAFVKPLAISADRFGRHTVH